MADVVSVWKLDDGLIRDWYIASSADDAWQLHREVYEDVTDDDRGEWTFTKLDDDAELIVYLDGLGGGAEPDVRTAREWAEKEPRGMLCSSEF